MQIQSFSKIMAMSADKLKEAMAPIYARKMKAKAELEMVKIDSDIIDMESKISESLTNKDVCFPTLMNRLDELALLERRRKQYEDVLEQLFPKEDAASSGDAAAATPAPTDATPTA